jgi:hypothetical protein
VTGIVIAAIAAAVLIAASRGAGSKTSSMLPTPGVRRGTFAGRAAIVRVPPALRRMRVVLYGHGFGQTIDAVNDQIGAACDAIADPAVLVIPQLGPKSELGDLADPGALRSFLSAALDRDPDQWGPLDVVVHSGGYRLAALAATSADLDVRSIGLLDALYGEVEAFVAFSRRRRAGRRIASIFGPTTKDSSVTFIAQCKAAGVSAAIDTTPADHLSSAAIKKATAVALATSVFHPAVPAAYAAPLIEAFGP